MELFDAVNLCWTGDHLGGSDDQDTPSCLERRLHRIDFEGEHTVLADSVELVTFTGAEDDGLPIDDEFTG